MFSIKKLSSVLFLAMWVCAGSFAQSLIQYLPEANKQALDKDQRRYHEVAMSWPFAVSSRLATIDVAQFHADAVDFNFYNAKFTAERVQMRTPDDLQRKSWVGKFPGTAGEVHLVVKGNDVTGMVQLEDLAFLIRPLGKGLHAIIEWDMTRDEGCQTPAGDRFEYPGGTDAAKYQHFPLPDLQRKEQVTNRSAGITTGECNVRVLVAYTDDVDAAVPDVLSDIINMVNLANTGYTNSSTGGDAFQMSIELAVAFEVNYGETGDIGDDLDNFTGTADGQIDGIHAQRQLWDADQCVLLTTTGTGLGWISTDYEDQFSVTGQGNFYALTFHHELGHNALCTHAEAQATEPGSAPWAGWGEPTTGCFRTVMAYQDACGMNPCPRHNIFSDDDANTWMCGGTNYTPGTANARNQDRLTMSAPILVAHETVSNNLTLSDDYNWQAREAVNVAANNTVTYVSPTNQFEYMSGSAGSFRASDRVTLGRGFWARSGTSFRAYLEDCDNISFTGGGTDDRSAELQTAAEEAAAFTLQIQPNPFAGSATVAFELPKDDFVEITLWDRTGQRVHTILPPQQHPAGKYSVQLDQPDLPPGFYLLKMTVGKEQKYLKVIRS